MQTITHRPGQATVEMALLTAVLGLVLVGSLAGMSGAIAALWPRIEESAGAWPEPTPAPTSPPGTPAPTTTPVPTSTMAPTASPTPTVTPTATATPCVGVTVVSGPSVTIVPSGTKHNATISWTASVASAGQVAVSRPNQSLSSPLNGSPFSAGTGTSHSVTVTTLNSGTYQYQVQMPDACTGTWQAAGSGTFVVP